MCQFKIPKALNRLAPHFWSVVQKNYIIALIFGKTWLSVSLHFDIFMAEFKPLKVIFLLLDFFKSKRMRKLLK